MASLQDEEVMVKLSICKKCNGWVRAAIEHKMSAKSKKVFFKEVMKCDLDVKSISLIDYRNNKVKYCTCK